jgi:hypothetical protein
VVGLFPIARAAGFVYYKHQKTNFIRGFPLPLLTFIEEKPSTRAWKGSQELEENMKRKNGLKNVLLGIFTLAFAFMVIVSPAAALGGLQEVTPPVVDPDPPTVIIPETGGDTTNIFIDNWLLFLILGIILIVLLVALVARGGGTTHHHHE